MLPNPLKKPLLKILNEDHKLLIGLGCSFTQGQGSYSIETQEKRNWNIRVHDNDEELVSEAYNNSWVNLVAKEIGYMPINLGQAGGGNRQAAKSLHMFHNEKLQNAKEKIVIFMMTGLERFSYVAKNFDHDSQDYWFTCWPNDDVPNDNPMKNVWKGYATDVYDDNVGFLETYLNLMEVITWCKAHNAKLILTPAFSPDYINELFLPALNFNPNFDFFYPKGRLSMFHYLLEQDGFNENTQNGGYWEEINFNDNYPKGTEHVSRCCHPNQKGHEVIAKILIEELKRREYIG